MLKTRLFLICFIISFASYAQMDGEQQDDVVMEDNIFLMGQMSEYFEGDILPGTIIKATSDGKVVSQGKSDGDGNFNLVLHFEKQYLITFSRAGYMTKKISIDTRGVPVNKRRKCADMDVEITLFKLKV